MKHFLTIILIAGFITPTFGQQKQASVGFEFGLPFKEYMTIMAGVSGGYEHHIWEQVTATGIIGIQFSPTNSTSYFGTNYKGTIPIFHLQVGGKYHFNKVQDGFYGHVQLGFHNLYQRYVVFEGTSSETTYSSGFGGTSWAIGGGYQTAKFDISARVNGVAISSSRYYTGYAGTAGLIYLGLRAAYLIPVGN